MLEALDIALFNKDKQSILSTIQPLKWNSILFILFGGSTQRHHTTNQQLSS
jgi:hypothetical protein